MNSDLLRDIYKAKDDRRKRLVQLPLDEKMVIIERLRDMAIALRAAKEEFARKYLVMDEAEKAVTVPGTIVSAAPKCVTFVPVHTYGPLPKVSRPANLHLDLAA